ncbi:MAG TPA: hypothetical protein ENL06_00730 [Candidatus Portnoybacteria bacterium]|nr:hypothetical protein [Candidatus Portnoybacteria bacterium]
MKLEYLKKNTQDLLVLNKNLLRTLENKENVLDANIKYWLKKGELISLKKGMYILKDIFVREKNKDKFLEYLAEQMIQPSYLSVEYILAKYQILSEPVQSLTLVTIKKTQEIQNNLGIFRYYSITKKLFIGYENKNNDDLIIFEATKAKALFDFLYFRFLKERPVNTVEIDNLRLNWENISQKEFQEAKRYLKLTNSKKLKKLFKIIEEKYYA